MVKWYKQIMKEENPKDHENYTEVFAGMVLLVIVLVLMLIQYILQFVMDDEDNRLIDAFVFFISLINFAIDITITNEINGELKNSAATTISPTLPPLYN